jgi:hypothetical protein
MPDDIAGAIDPLGLRIPREEPVAVPDAFRSAWENLSTPTQSPEGVVGFVRSEADNLDPKVAERTIKAALKSRLPIGMVSGNLEEVEKDIDRYDFDANLYRNSPKVAHWLAASAPRMALAVEDTKALVGVDTLLSRPTYLWPKPEEIVRAEAEAVEKDRQSREEAGPKTVIGYGFMGGGAAVTIPAPSEEERKKASAERLARDIASRMWEEQYIKGDAPPGFWESVGATIQDNPIAYLPFVSQLTETGKAAAMYQAVKNMEAGTATVEQVDFLVRAARLREAARARGKDALSWAGDAVAHLPAFMGEFLATGGAYRAGKVGAYAATSAAKQFIGNGLRRALAVATGAAAQAVSARSVSVAGGTIERTTPQVVLSEDDQRAIQPIIAEEGDGFAEAFAKSVGNEFLEVLSERSGVLFDKYLVAPAKGWVIKNILKKYPGIGIPGLKNFLSKAGWNGVIGEVFEERVSEGLRAVAGVEPYTPPTADQLLGELIAFSIPGAPGAVVGAAQLFVAPSAKETATLLAKSKEKMLGEVSKVIAGTKTAQAVPEEAEDLVRSLSEATENETLYQSAADWKIYFESKGLDPRQEAVRVLGSADEYDKAVAIGADIQIPMARYIAAIANTDHEKFFQSEVRVGSPDALSGKMADELSKATIKAAEAVEGQLAIREEIPHWDAIVADAAEVEKTIRGMLWDAGFTRRDADVQAKLYASRSRIRAMVRGVMPMDLLREQGLNIERYKGGTPSVEPPVSGAEPLPTEAKAPSGGTKVAAQEESAKAGKLFQPPSEEYDEKLGEIAIWHFGLTDDLGEAGFILPDGAMLKLGEGGRRTIAHGVGVERLLEKHKSLPANIAAIFRGKKKGPLAVLAFQKAAGAVRVSSEGGGISLVGIPSSRAVETFISKYRRAHYGEPLPIDLIDPETGNVIKSGEIPATVDSVMAFAGQLRQPGKRGYIQFGKGYTDIVLLASADRSTFLHETGHLWMRELAEDLAHVQGLTERTPIQERFLKDAETIREFLGAESLSSLTVEQEEKWAQAFEKYLIDGKPPSAALRAAFHRFRAWLVGVYKALTGIDLTPEVREVMDRLVATELEIAWAQKEYGHGPMFPDPQKAGMSPEKAAQYEAALAESEEAATSELADKMLATWRAQRTPEFMEAEAGIRRAVEAELSNTLSYQAIDTLRRKTLPDGTRITVLRSNAVEIAGERSVRAIERKHGADLFVPDGTAGALPASYVSDAHGYPTPAVMLRELASTMSIRAAVDIVSSDRMRTAHPEWFTEPSRDAAMVAVFNEKRSKVVQLELEHLAIQQPGSLKGIVKFLIRRINATGARRAVIGEAKTRILNLLVGGQPGEKGRKQWANLFARAAARARAEAAMMFGKGNYEAATQQIVNELANTELAREAANAKDEVVKAFKLFRKANRADTKLAGTHDMDLVNAARSLLAACGIGTARDEKRATEYLEKLRRYDRPAHDAAMAAVDGVQRNAKNYRDMTYGEFFQLRDAVVSMLDSARKARLSSIGNASESLDAVAAKVAAQVNAVPSKDWRQKSEFLKYFLPRLSAFRAIALRVESWAIAMDAGNPDAPLGSLLYRPMSEAAAKYRAEYIRLEEEFGSIWRPLAGELSSDPIEAPELPVSKTFSGRFRTLAELLHCVLHFGNDSNAAKNMLSRGFASRNTDGTIDYSIWKSFFSRAMQQGIIRKEHMDAVENTWRLFDSMLPDMQRVHKELHGIFFKEIEPFDVETPWGTYKGGYAPAVVDYELAPDEAVHDPDAGLQDEDTSYMLPTDEGMTKIRAPGYYKPLRWDMRSLSTHFEKVARYIHVAPAAHEVNKILWHPEVRTALDNHDPQVRLKLLLPWLHRTARQKVEAKSDNWIVNSKFWRTVRSNAGMNVMLFNVTNAAQQFTGFEVALTLVDWKYLRRALGMYMSDRDGMASTINTASEFMRTSTMTQMMEVERQTRMVLSGKNPLADTYGWLRANSYILQTGTQGYVNNVTWLAAHEQAIERGAAPEQAVAEADSVIRRTQGAFNPEDVALFEAGTPFMRMFTLFSSYFNMKFNLMYSEFTKTLRTHGLRKGMGRLIQIFFYAQILPAVSSGNLVRAMQGIGVLGIGPKDDEDDWLTNEILFGVSDITRESIAMIPGGSVFSSVVDIARMGRAYGAERLSISPAVQQTEAAIRGFGKAFPAFYNWLAEEDGKELTGRDIRDFLSGIGFLSGIPAFGAVARPAAYLRDVQTGKKEPAGVIDYTRGIISGR